MSLKSDFAIEVSIIWQEHPTSSFDSMTEKTKLNDYVRHVLGIVKKC